MENRTLMHNIIQWTRKSVVTLSIIIIITSLSQYSKEAIPIFTLLPGTKGAIDADNNENLVNRIHSFGQALIQDRRLIATLVAAQTSIFCPLFLLVGNAATCMNHHHHPSNADQQQQHSSSSVVGFWKTALDLLCQIIMPLGLAMNWLFCLSFDHKTSQLIHVYFPTSNAAAIAASTSSPSSIWSFAWSLPCDVSINFLEGLKYLTIMVLGLEMILVCIAWIQHCLSSDTSDHSKQSKSIQLV
ncbi:hypothetical protein BCR42DRAFT_472094 [Absidia repens]|uniref:Uncharacterized protein n=1 Tax=Absidia repens TaxID=90262 RepID=A0A1X2I2E1_9FUNG|nr:hypothetical protein BCR42DRAFT_472094 [Absidia repens]